MLNLLYFISERENWLCEWTTEQMAWAVGSDQQEQIPARGINEIKTDPISSFSKI